MNKREKEGGEKVFHTYKAGFCICLSVSIMLFHVSVIIW